MIAPEVLPDPINPPRLQPTASLEAFGGGQGLEQEGQEIQKIGQASGDIAAFEKIRADQAAVQEAVGNKLSPGTTQLLGDMHMRIHNATTLGEIHAINDEFRYKYNEMAKDAAPKGNPSQIGAYNAHAYSMGDSFNRTMMTAGDQRFTALDKESLKSFHDNMIIQDSNGAGQIMAKDGNNPYAQHRIAQGDNFYTDWANRNGVPPDQRDVDLAKFHSNYQAAIINHALYEKMPVGMVNSYYNNVKDQITDPTIRNQIESNLEKIPVQQQALQDRMDKERYKTAENQLGHEIATGNGNISELQRKYANDEIDRSTYDFYKTQLGKDPKNILSEYQPSDSMTFNSIRGAQRDGSKTPNEILRGINAGVADGKINATDKDWLVKQTKSQPPSPVDRMVDAQADVIRANANKFLGNPPNIKNDNPQVENIVSDFHRIVDGMGKNATAEQIRDASSHVLTAAQEKQFPSMKPGTFADAYVDVAGKVSHLFNPDQKATAQYTITRAQIKQQENR